MEKLQVGLTCFGSNTDILNEKYFALIKGDISGIQKFVYTITSEGATSALKGRSFFLQLLSYLLTKKVLNDLELPETNILYDGGGHFYILAPNIEVKNKVKDTQIKIEKMLFHTFNGKLGFLLDLEELSINDFCGDKSENAFSFVWEKVSKKVNQQKYNRFVHILNDTSEYAKNWGPIGEGGKLKQCKVCKTELENENEEICSLCNSLKELGRKLRDAEYILVKRIYSPNSIQKDKCFSILENLEYKIAVCSTEDISKVEDKFIDEIIILNSTNFEEKLKNISVLKLLQDTSITFRPFGINTPTGQGGNIKTFEDLGKKSDGKIGIMRADVDELSAVFQKGLERRATISRMSTLSNSLQYFFEGWLSKFLEKKYKNDIYLIYSGGDDMLLVGAWDKIISASYEIRKKFQEYTCYNRCFSMSTGITVTGDKFPIYRSAELSGNAEKESKKFIRNGKSKNAVTIFDITVGWEEYENYKSIWYKLYNGIKVGKDNKKMPQSLLRKLFMISYLYEKEKKFLLEKNSYSLEEISKLVQYSKWMWYLIYTIARSKDKTFESELTEIQNSVLDEKIIDRLQLPLRLTELSLRIKKEEKNG